MVTVAIHDEGNVTEAEGLGVRLGLIRHEEVLGGSEEPVEGRHSEVNDGFVELAFSGVGSVEDLVEGSEDRDVGRVGSGCWVIRVAEALEKSRQ